MVCTVHVDERMDDALDEVGGSVSQSCIHMDSEEVFPALQDERSVMSFLVRPSAILTSQFFLSYDDCGDDRFSPVMGGCVPPTCYVDLDSLWMLPWDER